MQSWTITNYTLSFNSFLGFTLKVNEAHQYLVHSKLQLDFNDPFSLCISDWCLMTLYCMIQIVITMRSPRRSPIRPFLVCVIDNQVIIRRFSNCNVLFWPLTWKIILILKGFTKSFLQILKIYVWLALSYTFNSIRLRNPIPDAIWRLRVFHHASTAW